MLLEDCFTEKEKNIYYEIQIASMKNGILWEIVFLILLIGNE